jgi:hypothetical protein
VPFFFAAKQSGNTPFDTVQIPAAMVAEKSGFNFFDLKACFSIYF